MMRTIIAVAAFLCAAAPAAAAERRFTVTDFDRVVVEGPFQVQLRTGLPSAAAATGSPDALDRVTVDVVGRTLRIRPNRSAWGASPRNAGPVALSLSTRDLRGASVSGPGSIAIDRARGMRLDFAVHGSGRIVARNLTADLVIVGAIGSGAIELAGTAKELRATLQGAAALDSSALRADSATIATDSAGAVRLAAVRTATVTASGLGEVEVIGSPACTVRGLAAGQVRCGRSDQR